jgi:hypothetical protein
VFTWTPPTYAAPLRSRPGGKTAVREAFVPIEEHHLFLADGIRSAERDDEPGALASGSRRENGGDLAALFSGQPGCMRRRRCDAGIDPGVGCATGRVIGGIENSLLALAAGGSRRAHAANAKTVLTRTKEQLRIGEHPPRSRVPLDVGSTYIASCDIGGKPCTLRPSSASFFIEVL